MCARPEIRAGFFLAAARMSSALGPVFLIILLLFNLRARHG
jgi:hypothetical protein